MRNISCIVKPGGYLMLGLTQGSSGKAFTYGDGAYSFPYVDLATDEISNGYGLSGFDLSTLRIEKKKAVKYREYEYVLMVIARKNAV
jgi:hypothetical protein